MLGPHEYVGRRAQMSIFPTKILLAIDGSESATHATQAAVELSKKTDSELQVLDAEVEKVRAVGGTVAEVYLRTGSPAAEVVDLAEELGVGLVVVGSRGLGGIRRALIGSVSDSVVRHAHCSVLVVRKEDQ